MKNSKLSLGVVILSLCVGCQQGSDKVINIYNGSDKEQTESKPATEAESAFKSLLRQSYLPLSTKSFLAVQAQIKSVGGPEIKLENIQKAYADQQLRISSDVGILNISKSGVDYLLTATSLGAGALGVTVPAAIAIEVTNKALNQALEYGISEMERKSQEEAARLLSEKLRQISARELKDFDNLKNLSPDVALKKAEGMADRWISEKDLEGLSTAERAEARAVMGTWMARTALAKLAAHQSGAEIARQNTEVGISESRKQLLALDKTLKTFAKQTGERLEKMLNLQTAIGDGLTQISTDLQQQGQRIDKISEDTAFLKDFAFSRMSAREQLNYLKKQRVSGEAQAEANKKLALLEKKIEFEENYRDYFSGAQNLITIASNLGVNADTVQGIADGLVKVDRLKNGIENIMQQNYLAGIASLSGLFGGGGDAEAAKHRAIMMKLDKVLENQQLISEQIQVSFKIQVEMLNKLSEQLRQSTETLYAKSDKVHNDVLGNREILKNLMHRGLEYCGHVADIIRQKGLQNAFLSRSNFRRYLSDCSLEYESLFRGRNFNSYFSSGIFKTALTKESFEAEEALYNDSLMYLSQKFGGYLLTLSLKNPSENAFGLFQKEEYLRNQSGHNLPASDVVRDMGSIKERLFSPAVVNNLQRFIAILPAVNIWNARESEAFVKIEDLLKLKMDAGRDELMYVDSALELVNNAIAQEALMSGDAILPLLYADFAEIQDEENKCLGSAQVKARCLLRDNRLLFQNFVLYSLYKEFKEQGYSLAAYKQQLRIKNDVKGFRNLLKNNWKVQWNAEKGLYEMTVAGVTIPAPSFDEVVEAKMQQTAILPALLRTREDLLHLSIEMRMKDFMNLNDLDMVHQLYIK